MNRVVKSLILDRISNRREILRLLRNYTGGRAIAITGLVPSGERKVTLSFRRLMEVATRDFSLRQLTVSLTAYAELYLLTEEGEVLNAEDSVADSLFPSFSSDPDHGLRVDLEAPEGFRFAFSIYENTDNFGKGQAIDIWCPRVEDGRLLKQFLAQFFTIFPHDSTECLCHAFRNWIVETPSERYHIGMNFRTWSLRIRSVGGDVVLSFSHENRSIVQRVVSGFLLREDALLSYQANVIRTVEDALAETTRRLFSTE